MWTISELKERAKINVKDSYWGLVLVSFLFMMFSGSSSGGSSAGSASGNFSELNGFDPGVFLGIFLVILVVVLLALAVSFALTAFVKNPIQVGAFRYYINTTQGPQTVHEVKALFMTFRSGIYMNVVKVMFKKTLYQFLWSLLFIVPGIIKSYEYRMIPYLLAEDPTMDEETAFRLSREMMDGEKANAWVLDLSFIGWIILTIFTCGALGVFYVNPYYNMTAAHLYLVLKRKVPGFNPANYNPFDPYEGAAQQYYQTNSQMPSGYDMNGQPTYNNNQSAMQQPYGYSQNPVNYDQQNYSQQNYGDNYYNSGQNFNNNQQNFGNANNFGNMNNSNQDNQGNQGSGFNGNNNW